MRCSLSQELAAEGEQRKEVLVAHYGPLLAGQGGEAAPLKDARGELDAVGTETDGAVVVLEHIDAAPTSGVTRNGAFEHHGRSKQEVEALARYWNLYGRKPFNWTFDGRFATPDTTSDCAA